MSIVHSAGLTDRWWSHHLETEASSFEQPFGKDRRKKIWKLLARSEELDRFLGKKFPNLKRYGMSAL
jgi:probable 2-oxoglutarate dehydrogenase E1 component DHKTD1